MLGVAVGVEWLCLLSVGPLLWALVVSAGEPRP